MASCAYSCSVPPTVRGCRWEVLVAAVRYVSINMAPCVAARLSTQAHLKRAVYVVPVAGAVMAWVWALPSDQLLKLYVCLPFC